jgi:hypothetical protein
MLGLEHVPSYQHIKNHLKKQIQPKPDQLEQQNSLGIGK